MAIYFASPTPGSARPGASSGCRTTDILDNDTFRQTFQNAFVFTGIAVAFKVVLGIWLALLLTSSSGSSG